MKKLTLILLLTVWSCLFSSRVEARPPLESGTHTWRQVTYGTLGLTLSAVPYVYCLRKVNQYSVDLSLKTQLS